VQDGSEIRVTTAEGTDLTIDMRERPLFAFDGHATQPGAFSAMPEGEVTVCPAGGTSTGRLVEPVAIERRDIVFPRQAMVPDVERGEVVRIEGGREARLIETMPEENGRTARNIAGHAVGTSRWARVGTTLREAKKAYGTFHVGLGDNRSFGGSIEGPLHLDLVFAHPTVLVDGRRIVENGELVSESVGLRETRAPQGPVRASLTRFTTTASTANQEESTHEDRQRHGQSPRVSGVAARLRKRPGEATPRLLRGGDG